MSAITRKKVVRVSVSDSITRMVAYRSLGAEKFPQSVCNVTLMKPDFQLVACFERVSTFQLKASCSLNVNVLTPPSTNRLQMGANSTIHLDPHLVTR